MRFLVLFFFTILITPINAQSIKIGYIDVEKVINNSSQYQQENIALIQLFEPKKQQLLGLFKHIELLKNNLNNVETTVSNETYQKELEKIRELEISFQKDTELWQQQLNQKKRESLQKIEVMINRTIEEFAVTENYDLILYQNAAFASDEVNISNKIISKIEELSP
jgi:outer membrane protein